MADPIPSFHFDAAALPGREGFDRWRMAAAAYELSLPDDEANAFQAQTDAWAIGDLAVTSNRLSALRFQRTAARAKADGLDAFSFLMLKQGTWTGEIDGRLLTIGPGQIVGFDLTRPMDAQGSRTDSVTVTVGRATMEAALPQACDLHGAVFGAAVGRLLADHFLALVRHLPSTTLDEAPAVAAATVGLIAAGAGAAVAQPQDTPGSALQHRVRRYVDQNLTAPDLSPAVICRELALSRSALYRAFSPLQGIAAYIRTRRLEAVHVLLGDPGEERNIAAIAYTFGFVSEAHFSRAFRRQFGYSPREARLGRSRKPAAGEPGPELFQHWAKAVEA